MRKTSFKRIFSLISILLALSSLIIIFSACTGSGNETESSQNGKNESFNYSFDADISQYLRYLNPKDSQYKLLVNKKNPLGKNYTPSSLVDIDTSLTFLGKNIELEKYTAMAALAMLAEMKADGIRGVYITSGYRTYEKQSSLWYTYIEKESNAHPDWSSSRIEQEVLTYSARPGTSEHQSGLCIDFITGEMTELVNYGSETPNNPYDIGFAETAAFEWLSRNAYKFGFILRYPESKEGITEYNYESWHYRFVGQAAAAEMHETGECFEEYLNRIS